MPFQVSAICTINIKPIISSGADIAVKPYNFSFIREFNSNNIREVKPTNIFWVFGIEVYNTSG